MSHHHGPSQIFVDNGRVTSMFKTINGIAIVVISALLIWVATTVSSLNVQVAVLVSQSEAENIEHTRFENRISSLERERSNNINRRNN